MSYTLARDRDTGRMYVTIEKNIVLVYKGIHSKEILLKQITDCHSFITLYFSRRSQVLKKSKSCLEYLDNDLMVRGSKILIKSYECVIIY